MLRPPFNPQEDSWYINALINLTETTFCVPDGLPPLSDARGPACRRRVAITLQRATAQARNSRRRLLSVWAWLCSVDQKHVACLTADDRFARTTACHRVTTRAAVRARAPRKPLPKQNMIYGKPSSLHCTSSGTAVAMTSRNLPAVVRESGTRRYKSTFITRNIIMQKYIYIK
jgi:hypothetical protein